MNCFKHVDLCSSFQTISFFSKWEVADSVLEVFHKLLRNYEPQPSDFIQETVELQGEQLPADKPPGHSIMFHLLNDSPMLALCLSLLEEGVRQLDTYAPFSGEQASHCCQRNADVDVFSSDNVVRLSPLPYR